MPSVANKWISRLSAKAASGNDRRFIYKDLATENTEGTEELVIRFDYRPVESKEQQDQLNARAGRQRVFTWMDRIDRIKKGGRGCV